ncbi:cytochrome c biogenesis protein CcsA [Alicyclobacillus acidocaldarius]|uniref:Cytochrome c assembly protein n=1 Tax=Alicyclobacillus acidocaldarius (strain Tc-4-1) TaxID=1048834 RepID=F8IDJ8_ALIAT|nr:cytochrome c biogenesis protein CcsA [Alicyclobacillus acidocaldarius]AEJ43851.1 cytochrome c assembly protein [Alicyclobacillus acidocaldarius subsp. acidocaldarius Tc-4-1]
MGTWYVLSMVAYALALVWSGWSFVRAIPFSLRVGYGLYVASFALVTAVFLARLASLRGAADYSRGDLALFIAWLMITVTVAMGRGAAWSPVALLLNAVGFGLALLAGGLQAQSNTSFLPASSLLALHVALAVLGDTAFAFSFSFALMHLVLEERLRRRLFDRWYLHLPSLATLDSLSLFASATGAGLLFLAVVTGLWWGDRVLHQWLLTWPKFMVTAFCLMLYVSYLVWRMRRRVATRAMMVFQVICFVAVLSNLLFVGGRLP